LREQILAKASQKFNSFKKKKILSLAINNVKNFLLVLVVSGQLTPFWSWVGSAKWTCQRAKCGLASEISIRIFFEKGSDFVTWETFGSPHRT